MRIVQSDRRKTTEEGCLNFYNKRKRVNLMSLLLLKRKSFQYTGFLQNNNNAMLNLQTVSTVLIQFNMYLHYNNIMPLPCVCWQRMVSTSWPYPPVWARVRWWTSAVRQSSRHSQDRSHRYRWSCTRHSSLLLNLLILSFYFKGSFNCCSNFCFYSLILNQLQLYTAKSQYGLHKAQVMNIGNLNLIRLFMKFLLKT